MTGDIVEAKTQYDKTRLQNERSEKIVQKIKNCKTNNQTSTTRFENITEAIAAAHSEAEPQQLVAMYGEPLQAAFTAGKEHVARQLYRAAGQKHPSEKLSKNKTALEELAGEGTRTKRQDRAAEILYEEFTENNHVKTLRSDRLDTEMWIYQDGIYVENAKSYIQTFCRHKLRTAYRERLSQLVVERVKAETWTDRKEFFEPIPHKLCLQNGVFNLETQELEQHTPHEVHHQKLPVTYDPDADCQKVLTFFNEVLTDDQDLKVLQEIFGFTLRKEYFIEKAFMFLGGGRNGKSKVLEILGAMLGRDNVSNIGLQTLGQEDFSRINLFGKLANICPDLSNQDLRKTHWFKQLIGRDQLNVNRKQKSYAQFVNYAKMIFAANGLPKTNDTSTAFFDRWMFLDFPNTYLSQSQLDKKSPEEIRRRNLKLRDPNRVKGLKTEQQMSGLFNWSIEGYNRLRENKSFTKTQSTEDIRTRWIAQSDSFKAFCMQALEEDYNAYVVKEDLREAYDKWCHQMGVISNKDKRDQTQTLRSMYGVDTSRKRLSGYSSQQVPIYRGIKPIEKYEGHQSLKQNHYTFNLSTRGVDEKDASEATEISVSGYEDLFEDANHTLDFEEVVAEISEERVQDLLEKGDLVEQPAGQLRLGWHK
jgi:P4 family phage/plasmid primase-like protien